MGTQIEYPNRTTLINVLTYLAHLEVEHIMKRQKLPAVEGAVHVTCGFSDGSYTRVPLEVGCEFEAQSSFKTLRLHPFSMTDSSSGLARW